MIKYKDAIGVVIIVIALIVGFVGIAMINTNLAPMVEDTVEDITLTENFESPDVTDTNPDGLSAGGTSIYSYAETDWTWANVTDDYGAPLTGQSYYVNDTDGNGCYSTFTFASNDYASASFYFMFDDTYHNESIVYLQDSDGNNLLYFNITDTKCECYEGDDTLLWSEDIDEGTWYKLSVALNWEGTFTASIYSVSIAGVLTSMGSGTGDMSAGAVAYGECAVFNVTGVNTQPAGLYIDNLNLHKDGLQTDIEDLTGSYRVIVGVIVFIVVIAALAMIFTQLKKIKK